MTPVMDVAHIKIIMQTIGTLIVILIRVATFFPFSFISHFFITIKLNCMCSVHILCSILVHTSISSLRTVILLPNLLQPLKHKSQINSSFRTLKAKMFQ
jgi:hypothetical protein